MSESYQMPTVGDLHRIAQRIPLVAAHFQMWRCGQFASFEQCLVSLAVELARANDRLLKAARTTADEFYAVRTEKLKVIADAMNPKPTAPDDFTPTAIVEEKPRG